MLNLSGIGGHCEKSLRLHFEKLFDFISFNAAVIKKNWGKELIAAFDPPIFPRVVNKRPA
jgi:hypothetical protein